MIWLLYGWTASWKSIPPLKNKSTFSISLNKNIMAKTCGNGQHAAWLRWLCALGHGQSYMRGMEKEKTGLPLCAPLSSHLSSSLLYVAYAKKKTSLSHLLSTLCSFSLGYVVCVYLFKSIFPLSPLLLGVKKNDMSPKKSMAWQAWQAGQAGAGMVAWLAIQSIRLRTSPLYLLLKTCSGKKKKNLSLKEEKKEKGMVVAWRGSGVVSGESAAWRGMWLAQNGGGDGRRAADGDGR